jgi:hypothetical protein
MTDRRGTNGMIAVLNDLYEENAALKARIKQLEALLKEAMHRPNPDMDLHNRIRAVLKAGE